MHFASQTHNLSNNSWLWVHDYWLVRSLSTAVTTPSAAAKTMFTFTAVPAFLKALMYARILVSTSPRVSERPRVLDAIIFKHSSSTMVLTFFNSSTSWTNEFLWAPLMFVLNFFTAAAFPCLEAYFPMVALCSAVDTVQGLCFLGRPACTWRRMAAFGNGYGIAKSHVFGCRQGYHGLEIPKQSHHRGLKSLRRSETMYEWLWGMKWAW